MGLHDELRANQLYELLNVLKLALIFRFCKGFSTDVLIQTHFFHTSDLPDITITTDPVWILSKASVKSIDLSNSLLVSNVSPD